MSRVALGLTAVVVATITGALVGASSARADRPDTPATTEIFRYDATDVVETYGSPGGAFLIHFTTAGSNAVPAADVDTNGVPDHVERVAVIYDDVLAFYRDTLAYRAPLSDAGVTRNGGDARFDVYLLDFGGSADGSFRTDGCGLGGAPVGQCVGFMVQENDFAGYAYPSVDYANRLLASHEFFHAVQAAYDSSQGSVLAEGTAVWASEAFDASLRDIEGFSGGYLSLTGRPIDSPPIGPVPSFAYGSSIFFEFLSERFGRDVIRELWTACDTSPWLPGLDALLTMSHGASFPAAYSEFAEWNLFTASNADALHYANGLRYAPVATTPVTLPYQSAPTLRVFYASSQYFSAFPTGRTTITAALVGDAAGLDVTLAVRRGHAISVATGPTADSSASDEVIAIVVNPARSGMSQHPGFCFGDPAEVAACQLALVPDAGAPLSDAGPPDATAPSDAMLDGGPPPPPTSGCGCVTAGRTARTPFFAVLGFVVVLRLRRARV